MTTENMITTVRNKNRKLSEKEREALYKELINKHSSPVHNGMTLEAIARKHHISFGYAGQLSSTIGKLVRQGCTEAQILATSVTSKAVTPGVRTRPGRFKNGLAKQVLQQLRTQRKMATVRKQIAKLEQKLSQLTQNV